MRAGTKRRTVGVLLDAYCALAAKAPWQADGTCADDAVSDEWCGDPDEYADALARLRAQVGSVSWGCSGGGGRSHERMP